MNEKVGRGVMPGGAGMDGRAGLLERVGARLVAVGLERVGGRWVCNWALGLGLEVGGLLRLALGGLLDEFFFQAGDGRGV